MAVPADGLPVLLRPGMEVWPVPPRLKGPRRLRVLAAEGSGTGQLLRLEGVADIDAASRLVGRSLLVDRGLLPQDLALHDPQVLLGAPVVDEDLGYLGTIAEVMRGVANDGWEVRGSRGSFLVPVVPDYVLGMDGEGRVHVSLPASMVSGGEEA